MHNDGSLYVSDYEKNKVIRWKKEETNRTIVAPENEQGDQLNQFNGPAFPFVDDDNDRVRESSDTKVCHRLKPELTDKRNDDPMRHKNAI